MCFKAILLTFFQDNDKTILKFKNYKYEIIWNRLKL